MLILFVSCNPGQADPLAFVPFFVELAFCPQTLAGHPALLRVFLLSRSLFALHQPLGLMVVNADTGDSARSCQLPRANRGRMSRSLGSFDDAPLIPASRYGSPKYESGQSISNPCDCLSSQGYYKTLFFVLAGSFRMPFWRCLRLSLLPTIQDLSSTCLGTECMAYSPIFRIAKWRQRRERQHGHNFCSACLVSTRAYHLLTSYAHSQLGAVANHLAAEHTHLLSRQFSLLERGFFGAVYGLQSADGFCMIRCGLGSR